MRAIDADALEEDFKTRYKNAEKWIEKAADEEIKIRATATRDIIGEVIMTIDNAQTVDITCRKSLQLEPESSEGHEDLIAEREDAKAYSKAHVDGDILERLKYYDSQQIGEILVKAYNSGLLAICGGMFNEKDMDECYIALMNAFKLLKTNLLYMRNIEAE